MGGDTPGSSLRRRHPSREGVPASKICLIREKPSPLLYDIRIKPPVRRIRHEMASKKCANRTFWTVFGKAGRITGGCGARKGGFCGVGPEEVVSLRRGV